VQVDKILIIQKEMSDWDIPAATAFYAKSLGVSADAFKASTLNPKNKVILDSVEHFDQWGI